MGSVGTCNGAGIVSLCLQTIWHFRDLPMHTQRTQYPLIKEYALNYRGLNIMI